MLRFLKWYLESVQGVQEVLLRQSEPNKLTFIGESQGTSFIPKMDHLVCFYAGVLALGSEHVQQPSLTHEDWEAVDVHLLADV